MSSTYTWTDVPLFVGIPSHITYGTYRQLQSDLHPPDDWITTVSPLLTDAAESDDIGKCIMMQFY